MSHPFWLPAETLSLNVSPQQLSTFTSASLRSNKSLDGVILDGVILDGPPSMDGSTTIVVIIGGSIV
jgi:hypothetical protein